MWEIFSTPTVVIDARDGSRVEIDASRQKREAVLVTFMEVAGAQQKRRLAKAYAAQAVDMEAAAVAAAASARGIAFGAIKVISDDLISKCRRWVASSIPTASFKTASFAAFAVMRPWLWKRVAQLAANSRMAAKALSEHLDRFRQELAQAAGIKQHLSARINT